MHCQRNAHSRFENVFSRRYPDLTNPHIHSCHKCIHCGSAKKRMRIRMAHLRGDKNSQVLAVTTLFEGIK
ncbi:Uncharacterised protein [Klebsiella pneumoniae]|nr:Uncharacterised protein [Klebsiella pneumoniae]